MFAYLNINIHIQSDFGFSLFSVISYSELSESDFFSYSSSTVSSGLTFLDFFLSSFFFFSGIQQT
jgi:hypothetical protein